MSVNGNGSCLIIRMKKNPDPGLHVLDVAIKILKTAGFDVQAGRLGNQIVLAALGHGDVNLAVVKSRVPGISSMEYEPFSLLSKETELKEAWEFMALEEQSRQKA